MLRSSFLVLLFSLTSLAHAETINIAVASNALAAIQYLSLQYTKQTGNKVNISSGSTGKLYAQIINGAPFDIFLAANVREPERLEKKGRVITGTRFTYAVGNISLCAYQPKTAFNSLDQGIINLKNGDYQRLSIANPKLAPYGIAAKQFLKNESIWHSVQSKLVKGENINQTFRYVVSGNVQYAIVALSQTKQKKHIENITCKAIPDSLYAPIEQQSVILSRAKSNKAAFLFMQFMKTESTRNILLDKFGYGIAGDN